MKALTLKHPWPFAVVALGKRLENRAWEPVPRQLRVGEWFAIHGGKVPVDRDDLEEIKDAAEGLIEQHKSRAAAWMTETRRHDITLADVLSCVGVAAVCRFGGAVTAEHRFASSPWFEGPYAWVLGDVFALPEPVPCRGAQGLWDLPADVLAEIRRQWKGATSQ